MIAKIDHIGIAVQSINESLKFFEDALGMKLDHIASEEGGRTQVAFMPVGSSMWNWSSRKMLKAGWENFWRSAAKAFITSVLRLTTSKPHSRDSKSTARN